MRRKRKRTTRNRRKKSRVSRAVAESKYITLDVADTVIPLAGTVFAATAGGTGSGFGISTGSGTAQRDGRLVAFQSCSLRLTAYLASRSIIGVPLIIEDDFVKVSLCYDKFSNGVIPTYLDVWAQTGPTSIRNADNSSRIRVVWSTWFKVSQNPEVRLAQDGYSITQGVAGFVMAVVPSLTHTYYYAQETKVVSKRINMKGMTTQYQLGNTDGELDHVEKGLLFWTAASRSGVINMLIAARWKFAG